MNELINTMINHLDALWVASLLASILGIFFMYNNTKKEKYNSMSFYEIFNLFKLSEKDIEKITKMSFEEFRILMSECSGFEQYQLLSILSFGLHKKKCKK